MGGWNRSISLVMTEGHGDRVVWQWLTVTATASAFSLEESLTSMVVEVMCNHGICAFLSLRGFGPGHSRLLVCLGLVFQLFPFVGPWAYGLRAHWLTVMCPLDTVGNMCSFEGGQAFGGCGYSFCLGGLKACICVLRAFMKPVGTYRTYFELLKTISHDFGFSLFIPIFADFRSRTHFCSELGRWRLTHRHLYYRWGQ